MVADFADFFKKFDRLEIVIAGQKTKSAHMIIDLCSN